MLILVTLMMEAICFSESSVLTRETLRHIPEDGILQIDSLFDSTTNSTIQRNGTV
jgi:hypothetical protein